MPYDYIFCWALLMRNLTSTKKIDQSDVTVFERTGVSYLSVRRWEKSFFPCCPKRSDLGPTERIA